MLPAEGRPGEPPEWPLTTATERELDLWDDLWAKPQAVMWEQLGQDLEVALFVRTVAEAEQPESKTDLKKVVRQYLDSLGLSVQGMLRNRWKITAVRAVPEYDGPGQPEETEQAPEPPRRTSARDRMKVVPFRGPGA
jgi:hypothetical protein